MLSELYYIYAQECMINILKTNTTAFIERGLQYKDLKQYTLVVLSGSMFTVSLLFFVIF